MSSFWEGRAVLVTGGAGFIGSHLTHRLLDLGATVRVLDWYNAAGRRGHLEGVDHPALEVQLGDVADPYFTASMTDGIDTVFHLAALIGIPYSYVAPAQYVATNVSGTLAVLEASRQVGVRRVIHTSTSEVYGSAQYAPIDEAHPLVGQSPYSATKIAADKLAESYHRSFDVPVATIRPFNTFGPRQSTRAVIPTLMTQALYADEIVVGALDPVRDMNYVADTVAGFLAMGEASGVEGDVFNVGSGREASIGDILELVQKVAGSAKPVRQDESRIRPAASEVDRLLCDFSKAKATFGYEPTVSLEEGLEAVRDHLEAAGPEIDPTRYQV